MLQLNLKKDEKWANYRISLPNGQTIECLVCHRQLSIMIAEHEFPMNLIQFDMLEFNAILGIDWLTAHGANIDYKDLKVTLKDP